MYQFDMPLDQLKTCIFPQKKERDFDEFWRRIRARSNEQPLNPGAEPVDYAVPDVRVEKVSFEAFDGGRIVGWSITPSKIRRRPTIIFFHGYSNNKGRIANYLMWALQGFTCLAFDVRGQSGESSDFAHYSDGRCMGWLTSGVLEPESYYFVRCYMDAIRAIDFALTCLEVDPERIGTSGFSQGGGISLASASLDRRTRLCMAEVPAFCHFSRTLEITKSYPWDDLIRFFARRPQDIEQAMRTLSYVELNNLTDRIQCPTLISVGLQDEICVPSSIFAAYNRIPVREKLLEAFPYNVHEASLNIETMIAWARKYLMED